MDFTGKASGQTLAPEVMKRHTTGMAAKSDALKIVELEERITALEAVIFKRAAPQSR